MKKWLIPHVPSILALFSLLVWTTVQWQSLPAEIPVRFGLEGDIQEMGQKGFSLWVIPAGLALLTLLLGLVYRFTIAPVHHLALQVHFTRLSLATGILFSSLQFGLIQSVRAADASPLHSAFHFGFGFLLLISAFSLPQLPQNPHIGIKIPTTMASAENWYKTHLRGAWVFGGLGVLFIVLSFLGSPLWFPLVAFLFAGLYLILYSVRIETAPQ